MDKAAGYFENKMVYYPKSYLKPENLGLRRLINQVFGFSVCRLIRKKIHGAMRPLYSNFRFKHFFGCRSKQGNTVQFLLKPFYFSNLLVFSNTTVFIRILERILIGEWPTIRIRSCSFYIEKNAFIFKTCPWSCRESLFGDMPT